MKNIKFIKFEDFNNNEKFEKVEDYIYFDKESSDANNEDYKYAFVTALQFELEDGDSGQYPLEDILDKYSVSGDEITKEWGIIERDGRQFLEYGLVGELNNIKKLLEIIGKRVYNKENDEEMIELIIE